MLPLLLLRSLCPCAAAVFIHASPSGLCAPLHFHKLAPSAPLRSLSSLSQLYSLTMDVHSRLRTESHQTVTGEAMLQPPARLGMHAFTAGSAGRAAAVHLGQTPPAASPHPTTSVNWPLQQAPTAVAGLCYPPRRDLRPTSSSCPCPPRPACQAASTSGWCCRWPPARTAS